MNLFHNRLKLSIIFLIIINFSISLYAEGNKYEVPNQGIHKEKMHKLFACDSKPGAKYCDLLYNYTAARIDGHNLIYIPEYIFEDNCPCKDQILERMLISILENKKVQEEFLINEAGKYDNIEYVIPEKSSQEKIDSIPRFPCKDCMKVSFERNSTYKIEKYSVIFTESCSTEEKILDVRKITKINSKDKSNNK